jgi:3-deoxy-D-manno-octulosonate 8-phosphate phosphatase (KDO 8-P phosphatase)
MVSTVLEEAGSREAARELEGRARRIRLVLSDCDGVLTDGSVYYSATGEELKRFSLRDGMGMERLCASGIATAIVTREISAIVRRRAKKLRLPHLFEGVRDKAAHLGAIERVTGVNRLEMAFIGDDLNDLGIIAALFDHGLTGAPADAAPEVAAVVHHHGSKAGGLGAFREFADWILKLRGGSGGIP